MRWLNPCIGLLGVTLTLACGNSDEDPNEQESSNGQTSVGGSGHTAAGITTSNSDGSTDTTSGTPNSNSNSSTSASSTTAAGSTVSNAAATGVGTTSGAGGAGGAGVSSTTDGSGGDDSATASTDSQTSGTGGVGTATTSTTGEPGPCSVLSGQTYATVDELECGNTPAGPVYCRWNLSFTAAEFQWSRADTLQSGTYSCENGAISAESAGQVLEGELYDDGSLMWEGQTYVQAD